MLVCPHSVFTMPLRFRSMVLGLSHIYQMDSGGQLGHGFMVVPAVLPMGLGVVIPHGI